MTDTSDVIPVLAWWLNGDATIYAACNGQIIPGLQTTLADSYLTSPPYTCIGLHRISKTSTVSCFYQNDPSLKAYILIQIDIYSKTSEVVAQNLATLIEHKLQENMEVTYGGTTYMLLVESINTTPRYDDGISAWREIMTIRATVYYNV